METSEYSVSHAHLTDDARCAPQRLGVIDLGSNTARMIVLAYHPQRMFRMVDEVTAPVRLIAGAGTSVKLQPAPLDRAVNAIRMFTRRAQTLGVSRIAGVATSAVREATNQAEVLARLRCEAGVAFRVLSGGEEAYYGYLGALNSLSLRDGLIIDIGGGSVQVSLVGDRRLLRSASLPIGTVRMTERFLRSDPPTKAEWRSLEEHLDATFKALDWFALRPPMRLAGLGGTIRNLAGIDQKARAYPLDRHHAYTLGRERVEELCDELRKRRRRERADVPGLNPERADVILAGASCSAN